MKKTIITALIALLVVLAFAACDGIINESRAEKASYTYTEDGQKMVNVKIRTGGTSRALTDELAKASANYMEVIFKGSGTKEDARYFRTEGLFKSTLSINIPAIKYDENNAILLVGRRNSAGDDLTLLATGYTTDNASTTTEITFTLKPLKAELCPGKPAPNAPTFKINQLSGKDFDHTTDRIVAYVFAGVFENLVSSGTYTDSIGDNIPCFQVPYTVYDIEATLTINNFFSGATSGINIVQTTVNGSTTPIVKFNNVVGTSADIDVNDSDVDVDFDSNSCTIDFKFDAPNQGDYIITFTLPVVGFIVYDDSIPASIKGLGLQNQRTWNIRGGTLGPSTIKAQPDTGTGEIGVMLAVREVPFRMTDVTFGGNGNTWAP